MFRHHAQWKTLESMVRGGSLGDARVVMAQYAYLDDDFEGTRFNPELDGGVMNMVGGYPIAAANLLFGAAPNRVRALDRRAPKSTSDITCAAILSYDAGFATVHASVEAFDTQYVRFIGTKGSAELAWPFNPAPDQAPILRVSLNVGDYQELTLAKEDQFVNEFEHFASEVLKGAKPIVTEMDSLESAATLEAIGKSRASQGADIKVARL